MGRVAGLALVLCCLAIPSCRPTAELPRASLAATAEEFYAQGHRLYQMQQIDSASAVLARALAVDSTYLPALKDMAGLTYERAMKTARESDVPRPEGLREAFGYFRRLEELGFQESELYERLGELAVALKDNHSFLVYASKSAEKHPYDRQLYNLGLAYFEVADYNSVIRTQKQALEKFKNSIYVGGFYRQLGRAYMKLDRDQTAERTLVSGVQAVDARLPELRSSATNSEAVRRLTEDKISMLLLLKKLHITYNAQDKLQNVERQLKEAGK
jgi:tetratricopeptide (TPR) repeat protein